MVSNEIYRRDRAGDVVPAAPPSPATVDTLAEAGFDVSQLSVTMGMGWSS